MIYELGLDIVADTYSLTKRFPRSESWGLTQQMNRSAVSIVSNIAEGAGRGDDRDFARFLRIARGSACELDAQMEMSVRTGLTSDSTTSASRDRIGRVIASITKLERKLNPT